MPLITDKDIFLDFETRSRANLKKVGAWRYSEDESTTALCLGYAFGNDEPKLWTEGQPQPDDLVEAFSNTATPTNQRGYKIHAYNGMSFERAIFENVMFKKYGWLVPDLEAYYDTMLDALSLALPQSMENCGEALQLKIQKSKEGKRLIQYLCKPITSGKKKGEFRERAEHIVEYVALYGYCKQDVRSEREIYFALPYHVEGQERGIALMLARMNERGLPIDIPAVKAIIRGVNVEVGVLKFGFKLLTGVDSPLCTAQFLAWLQAKLRGTGLTIENVQAETVRDLLLEKQLPGVVRQALIMTQGIKKTSVAKYPKIIEMLCEDDTVKNNFIYHKANTGRIAGAGFQAQNLPGDTENDPQPLIDCFVDDDYLFLRQWKGVLNTASSLVRAMVKAPESKKFLNGDLKQIEARGTMWVAEEWDELDMIRQGHDPYAITASGMYRVSIEEVMEDYRNHSPMHYRPSGKIAVLAGGFGGGYLATLKMANKMGMDIDEATARRYSRDFRTGRPKLVAKWGHFDAAVKKAMMNPGIVIPVDKTKRIGFIRSGKFMYMVLPNRRTLSFPFPKMVQEQFYGKTVTNFSAMWVSSYTTKWEYRTLTGANLFQSSVQAICRDIIMEAHLRTEAAGYPLVLSVHDEGMSLVPDDARYSLEEYDKIMCEVPKWAGDFPLEADCWEGNRFKK